MNPATEYLQNFLAQADTSRPILPAAAYTDEAFFELENAATFLNNWVFAGFAHELEFPGDVAPITVANQPLLLLRNDDDQIRCFHNVCSHRCLQLVHHAGNCGSLIQCPYHAWVYDLDGQLKAAPYFGGRERSSPEGFPLTENGLKSVHCRTWNDWIFVCLADKPPSFAKFIEPLTEQVGEFAWDALQPVATLQFGVVKANWKALMENFIEPYHVQFVHKATTAQPLADHYTVINRHCLGSACDIDESAQSGNVLAVTSRFLTLFPNFVIGLYAPDQVGVHLNTPLSAAQTTQRRVIYVHRDSHRSAAQIDAMKSLWRQVHNEDHAICERLQTGRHSPAAAHGGLLSDHWEDSVRRFQELLAESLLE